MQFLRYDAHFPKSNFLQSDDAVQGVLDGEIKSIGAGCNGLVLDEGKIVVRVEFV